MEFLPLPSNSLQVPTLEIPCLSMDQYDGGDFKTYPERRGWGPRTIWEWDALFSKPTQEFSAFLQTWLFFGLLEAFFGHKINTHDFVREIGDQRQRVITTARLNSMLERWSRLASSYQFSLQRIEKLRADTVIAFRINASRKLKIAKLQPSSRDINGRCGLISYMSFNSSPECRDPRIALSMSVLTETLMCASYLDFATGHKYIKVDVNNHIVNPWANVIFRRMRSQGWCPADLTAMYARLNTAGLYFMHHIERPGKAKRHDMIRIRPASSSKQNGSSPVYDSNSLCTTSLCSSRVVDEEGYKTKHVQGCSGCPELVADYTEILRILRGGNIPLILSIDPNDDSETIALVESEPSISYAAISHVWSDGLGNPQRSALPRCQMRRLSNLVRQLPGKGSNIVLFWMDTICCPPDSANENEAQNLAIGMMRQTYEEATAVLVLDSWLQEKRREAMSEEEALMRIICSGWNSRLWTLQEGALAQVLFFQFSDAAYDVDEGVNRLERKVDIGFEYTLKPVIMQRIHEFRGFRTIEGGNTSKLLALANALSFRSTSVATDEPLCLSALLGFDTKELISVPPNDRMRIFWNNYKSIPYLFLSRDYPRLKDEGYGWAPQSFLSRTYSISPDSSPPISGQAISMLAAEIGDHGLSIQSTGIILDTEKCFLTEEMIVATGSIWNAVRLHLREADGAEQDTSSSNFDSEYPQYIVNLWHTYRTRRAAILFWPIPDVMAESLVKFGFAMLQQSLMFFVRIEREQDGVIYGRRICAGTVYAQFSSPPDSEDIHTRPGFLPMYQAGYGLSSVASGHKTSQDQRWCIF